MRLPAIVVPLVQTRRELKPGGFEGNPIEEVDWRAVMPKLPAAATDVLIFASVWVHSQNRGTGPTGLYGPELYVDFDGLFSESPFPAVPKYYVNFNFPPYTPGRPPEEAQGGPPPPYIPGSYAVFDHPEEIRYYNYKEEGFYVWPPGIDTRAKYCDEYFHFPCPTPILLPGPSPRNNPNLVVPKLSFRDPLWRATWVPPERESPPYETPRPQVLVPRAYFPKIITAYYRAEKDEKTTYPFGPFSPEYSHTEFFYPDHRIIIVPFTPGGHTEIGPGRSARVPK